MNGTAPDGAAEAEGLWREWMGGDVNGTAPGGAAEAEGLWREWMGGDGEKLFPPRSADLPPHDFPENGKSPT